MCMVGHVSYHYGAGAHLHYADLHSEEEKVVSGSSEWCSRSRCVSSDTEVACLNFIMNISFMFVE